jgi:hypothetical protein
MPQIEYPRKGLTKKERKEFCREAMKNMKEDWQVLKQILGAKDPRQNTFQDTEFRFPYDSRLNNAQLTSLAR